MKIARIIAMSVVLFVAAVVSTASAGNKLAGVWQCESFNGQPVTTVKFKVLQKDGTMMIIESKDGGVTFECMSAGTYNDLMPGVYVETLTQITQNVPTRTTPLSYDIKKGVMTLSYWWWNRELTETWKKVPNSKLKKLLEQYRAQPAPQPATHIRIVDEE